MIKCFVINLDRRKDRLEKISSHLHKNNFRFERFSAIDAENENLSELSKNISQYGPMGKISKGDLACFQSHYRLWKHIAENENYPILILEDDSYISKTGFKLLKNIEWIPSDSNIIKCERFGNSRHKVLLSPSLKSIGTFKLHFLLSKHSGTGGYIITPKGAKFLVEKSINVNVPVDHFLFNPNNSTIFNELSPIQIFPAICEQNDKTSNIHIYREGFSYKSLSNILREVRRGFYEIRLLPKQLFQLIFMKCILKKIVVSK